MQFSRIIEFDKEIVVLLSSIIGIWLNIANNQTLDLLFTLIFITTIFLIRERYRKLKKA